jgi:hypothetical protein
LNGSAGTTARLGVFWAVELVRILVEALAGADRYDEGA